MSQQTGAGARHAPCACRARPMFLQNAEASSQQHVQHILVTRMKSCLLAPCVVLIVSATLSGTVALLMKGRARNGLVT